MSEKQTNTENAERVASNGEGHQNSVQDAESEEQYPSYRNERIPTDEEEVKRILRTPSPNIWTKQLLRGM